MATTLKVNIDLTDDPDVVECRMRYGNKWIRAKLRAPGIGSGGDGTMALVDPKELSKALAEAKARGEMERKDGPGKLWVKVKPEAAR